MLEFDHMTRRKIILTTALSAALVVATQVFAQVPATPAQPAAAAASGPVIAAPAKPATAAHAGQTNFATPEEGAAALAAAVRAQDPQTLLSIVGPSSKSWIFSGDKVADRADWKHFLELYDSKHAIEMSGDGKATVIVGEDAWPFPAPLIKTTAGWHFDSQAGREEVLNRRVGRNELDTIQTLLAVVDAQREYVRVDYDKDGFTTYAKRFHSSPGKKDGLYWPAAPNEPESPLGDLVAQATEEGYVDKGTKAAGTPYHGYLFRMLTAQGPAARGGAFDYLVRGKVFGGFAVIAWPAKYANSGIMTFIVNHEGIVYECDLGDTTPGRVAKITHFNPDKSWKPAPE
jgi:hypothetical protein